MTQLTPIRLEDGTLIYIEATQNITVPALTEGSNAIDAGDPEETTRSDLGAGEKGWGQDKFNRVAAVQRLGVWQHSLTS